MSDGNGSGESRSRRTVLKATGCGVGLAAGVGSLGTATATDSDNECENCNRTVISETGSNIVVLVKVDGEYHLVDVDTSAGSVVHMNTFSAESMRAAETEAQRLLNQPRTQNHEEVFEERSLWTNDTGGCSTPIYSNHRSAGLSVKAGDSLDDLPSGTLEAALCAAIGARAGGPAGAALGAIVCYGVGFLFLDHVDLSGTELTIAAYDKDTGWFNYNPKIQTAVATEITEDTDDMTNADKIPGAHLGLGDDIEDVLNSVW